MQLLVLALVVSAATYARFAVGPLQETMRLALSLDDNQMALLQGPALALPMVAGAVPLGLLIDRHSRVRLLLLFSFLNLAGSVLTALAPNFAVLFASRCLIGLMVPAITIAAYSIVADLYAPAQRGRANMVMAIGQAAGMSAVFALGGALLAHYSNHDDGWRWSMLWLTSLLALSIAPILAMREPVRAGVVVPNPRLRDALVGLWSYRKILAPLIIGMIIVGVSDGAALIWAAPTLARNFALPPERVGSIMATVLLVMGLLGPVGGGMLADFAQRTGGPRRTFLVLSGLTLLSVPAGLFPVISAVFPASALLLLFVTIGFMIALIFATLVTVVIPNELRGLCLTIASAASSIVGGALAPSAVSLLSGALGGPAFLGQALAAVCVAASLIGAAMFVAGRRRLAS
jgi:MFS family permease